MSRPEYSGMRPLAHMREGKGPIYRARGGLIYSGYDALRRSLLI